MPVKTVLDGSAVPVRIWTDDIDEGSKAQLANIASLPFIHHHVAAMPDVHLGIGATIGSVIATHQAIIPAAVGVDIGCGMVAARLSLTANDIDEKRLKKVFDQISRDVPVGRDQHADGRVLVDAVRPVRAGPQGADRAPPATAQGLRQVLQVGEPDGHARRAATTSSRSAWTSTSASG